MTGVNISNVGIYQMILKAKQLDLYVQVIVADKYSFEKINEFDIILLDSMFHFS